MTVIDVAGGPSGGAARWRREAQAWVDRRDGEDVSLVGIGRRVEPRWLAERELRSWSEPRIAANNVSYLGGSARRVVVLCNALHFLRPGEALDLPGYPSNLRQQTFIVHNALKRAHRIVVPCTDMFERVAEALPHTRSRLVTRFHPITVERTRRPDKDEPYILVPILPAPHKDLTGTLRSLVDAVIAAGVSMRIMVTAGPDRTRPPQPDARGPA